ncbi:MAG: FAD-binding oxidoreductase [Candidatus Andersenbacteria bacterium]|nr:FAD-binding oxidoreductase [Candidatus Andersenbacteria bacterium]MBI3250945.1 FAD-binding oxidoreductase [Candidatus Andersenbacteria bacterium]
MPEGIVAALNAVIKGGVAGDLDTLTRYSRDASLFELVPQAVAYPKNTEDVQALVQYANQEKNISLTVRSGGTDMSGGALTESVVVDVNKHMNQIVQINDHEAVVQPGLFYRNFEKETEKLGVLLPSFPASKSLCTVGGMVANNSGGEKTLSYGKTEKYVKNLKAVLADGNEYTFRSLSPIELEKKKQMQTWEGEIYRRISSLLEKNRKLIKKMTPRVSKNSTGYSLWNVEKDGRFDLGQLLVGSQGTLGIITEITFRLIKPKPHSRMLIMFLRSTDNLSQIIPAVLRHQPESFESYDDNTLKLAMKFFPQLLKQMKTKIFSLALQFIPEVKLILTGGLPKLILIAEFSGYDEKEIIMRVRAAEQGVRSLVTATRITRNENEAEKYWTIRRESFNLLRKRVKTKKTAPFIDDFIIQPRHLPEFLPQLEKILKQYDIFYTIAGHVGDGNFHIIPLMDLADEKQRAIIPELSEKVYDLVFAYKGSMSAEHNDGLVRSHYLKKMYGEEVYKLFEEVKNIFDPNNIFNPGKKIGASKEYAAEHLIRG